MALDVLVANTFQSNTKSSYDLCDRCLPSRFVIPLHFSLAAGIMISRPEKTNPSVLFAKVLSTK